MSTVEDIFSFSTTMDLRSLLRGIAKIGFGATAKKGGVQTVQKYSTNSHTLPDDLAADPL